MLLSSAWGCVGLPNGLSLAVTSGADHAGHDISDSAPADIKSGRVDLLVRDHQRPTHHLLADSLRLTTEPHALAEADAILIRVPTPTTPTRHPIAELRGASRRSEHAVAGQTTG